MDRFRHSVHRHRVIISASVDHLPPPAESSAGPAERGQVLRCSYPTPRDARYLLWHVEQLAFVHTSRLTIADATDGNWTSHANVHAVSSVAHPAVHASIRKPSGVLSMAVNSAPHSSMLQAAQCSGTTPHALEQWRVMQVVNGA